MKRVFVILIALVVLACHASAAEEKPVAVAVFDFDSVYKVKLHLITDVLTS